MTDFLDNLRNGDNRNSKKQQMGDRKTNNKRNHYLTQRSHTDHFKNRAFQNFKRPSDRNIIGNQRSMNEILPSLLVETIDSLNSNLEILSESQKYMATAQKRAVDMMERLIITIEKMLDHIDINPGKISPESITKKRKIKAKLKIKNTGGIEHLSREEIMSIIKKMREQGTTFDRIAKHLTGLGQPTFSGRGEWHAQTIHRLCQ